MNQANGCGAGIDLGLRRAGGKGFKTGTFSLKSTIASAVLSFVLLVLPLPSAEAADPWQLIEEFTRVPGSPAMQIGKHYVAVLYENADTSLRAIVIFNADCGLTWCSVNRRAAYLVIDDEDSHARLYVEPQDREGLSKLIAHQMAMQFV